MQVRTLELDRNVAHGSDAGPLRQFLRAGHNLPFTAWLPPVLLKVALTAVAIWLAMSIADLRKTQDCVLMGRRDCARISVTPQG